MGKKLSLSKKRFGRLRVVNESEFRPTKHTYWNCLCDCGNETKVRGSYLNNKRTQSCGCYKAMMAELSNARQFRDLENKHFGRLKVLEMVRKVRNVFYWRCVCKCGNSIIANGSKLKQGVTKSCGCLKSEKLSKANKNKKRPRNKKGEFIKL